MSNKQLLLDTNIFNAILDGSVRPETFAGYDLIATHIQQDEIAKTPNIIRRTELEGFFKSVVKERVPTSALVFGVSKWGQAKWGNSKLFTKMLARLKQLDAQSKKSPRRYNQENDILIAITAVCDRLALASSDSNLRKVVSEFGGEIHIV